MILNISRSCVGNFAINHKPRFPTRPASGILSSPWTPYFPWRWHLCVRWNIFWMQIFHLKLFQLRQVQAKEPGEAPNPRTWLFCRLVRFSEWQLLQFSCRFSLGTSAASRLNATTANRQTWSIIFNGGHKLLMQAHPIPLHPTERIGNGLGLSWSWSFKSCPAKPHHQSGEDSVSSSERNRDNGPTPLPAFLAKGLH